VPSDVLYSGPRRSRDAIECHSNITASALHLVRPPLRSAVMREEFAYVRSNVKSCGIAQPQKTMKCGEGGSAKEKVRVLQLARGQFEHQGYDAADPRRLFLILSPSIRLTLNWRSEPGKKDRVHVTTL